MNAILHRPCPSLLPVLSLKTYRSHKNADVFFRLIIHMHKSRICVNHRHPEFVYSCWQCGSSMMPTTHKPKVIDKIAIRIIWRSIELNHRYYRRKISLHIFLSRNLVLYCQNFNIFNDLERHSNI